MAPTAGSDGAASEAGAPAPVRRTARSWYLLGVGLIITAITAAATGFYQMSAAVDGLHRQLMPGKLEVTLAAGRSMIYFEHHSRFDGATHDTPAPVTGTCRMTDAQGQEVAFASSAAQVSYAFGGYAGRKAYDVDIRAPGVYTLTCDGPVPFVVAVGGGLGAWIVVAVVGGLVTGLPGLAVLIVVFVKRRRQARRAA